MMDDLISRRDAIDAIVAWTVEDRPDVEMPTDLIGRITDLPSAHPEAKKGEWEEKTVCDELVIEQWQSARCSVCNKYHTTPFSYYFTDYNFCPICGADMRGETDAEIH